MARAEDETAPLALLAELEAVITGRRTADPAGSYVAGLIQGDEDRLLRKIGEEATELVLAAKSAQRSSIVAESADLLFHLMVMLARYDLGLKDVTGVLRSRLGRSGIAEKALRSQDDSS